MVTLQKSGKRKNHSNRVKITLKKSENHSKASENFSKESENNPKEWISLLGGAHRGTARNERAVPQRASPKKWNSLFWIFTLFGAIFTRFGTIFTLFEGDFHLIRVVFMLSTLLKSNHFTLFTLREYFSNKVSDWFNGMIHHSFWPISR